jgi:hypothetical protein
MAKRTGESGIIVLKDASTHEIKCIKAEEGEIEDAKFGNGDVIFFEFEVLDVVDGNGEPIVMKEVANDTWNPFTKAWQWAIGFGLPLDVGVEIDLEDFVGKTAIGRIENRVSNKVERSHIKEVFQPPASRKAS